LKIKEFGQGDFVKEFLVKKGAKNPSFMTGFSWVFIAIELNLSKLEKLTVLLF